jgi:cytochrome c2
MPPNLARNRLDQPLRRRRPQAASEGTSYSDAMKKFDHVWDGATLETYLPSRGSRTRHQDDLAGLKEKEA